MAVVLCQIEIPTKENCRIAQEVALLCCLQSIAVRNPSPGFWVCPGLGLWFRVFELCVWDVGGVRIV